MIRDGWKWLETTENDQKQFRIIRKWWKMNKLSNHYEDDDDESDKHTSM